MGDYEIVRKLGEGGMGSVFLAHSKAGAPVVLKTPLRPTKDLVSRMEDEARTGFRLRHRHIVRTCDFFTYEERPVLVIEWVDGASLKELRDICGRLPPAMVARIGEQVSDALSTIHHLKDDVTGQSLLMLHRDVTPGNILVDRDGDAKLIDLGIARSVESQSQKTAAGVLRGTFRYLSPDLFAGHAYSWMTDLWALGVTLFESAMGRRAIEGDNASVFGAIARGELTQLRDGEELHPTLRFLFDGLLDPDMQKRRFKDPEEVLHAFRVIRSRLGDGEAETRAVLAQIPMRTPPSSSAPSSSAPSSSAPSSLAPSSFAPSSFAPSSFAPPSFAPSSFAPSSFAPSSSAPSSSASSSAPSSSASSFAPSSSAPFSLPHSDDAAPTVVGPAPKAPSATKSRAPPWALPEKVPQTTALVDLSSPLVDVLIEEHGDFDGDTFSEAEFRTVETPLTHVPPTVSLPDVAVTASPRPPTKTTKMPVLPGGEAPSKKSSRKTARKTTTSSGVVDERLAGAEWAKATQPRLMADPMSRASDDVLSPADADADAPAAGAIVDDALESRPTLVSTLVPAPVSALEQPAVVPDDVDER